MYRPRLMLALLTIFLLTMEACDASKTTTNRGVPHEADRRDVGEGLVQDAQVREVQRDQYGFEILEASDWLRGDLHVHSSIGSNDTDGDSFPEAIQKRALTEGLDFVVMTDHSNSAGSDVHTTDEDPALFNQGPEFVTWDSAEKLSITEEFWLVSGNEISPVAEGEAPEMPTGHIGCVPAVLETFDIETPFIDRPRGQVNGAQALAQARERECFTILNHPYSIAPWVAFDWTSDDYDAIEVWNGSGGGFDLYDYQGYNAWRCDLLAGKSVIPVGASDNHRVYQESPGDLLNPALGWPHVRVKVQERSWQGIIEGLKSGDVTIQEGSSLIELEGFDENKNRTRGSSLTTLRVKGVLDTRASVSKLAIRKLVACSSTGTLDGPPVAQEEILLLKEVLPGDSFHEVIELESRAGVYTATLLSEDPPGPLGVHFGALSQAIVLRP